MGKPEQGPWSVQGWDAASLERYGLTQKMIIDTSEHRQGASGNWIDRSLDTLQNDFKNWASNPPDNIGDATLSFNLPICELDNLDSLAWTKKDCQGTPQICLMHLMRKNCPYLMLNDVYFPYQE